MFRVLFIFLILGLSLYGLFGVFSPIKQAADASEFDIYLSEALERNSQIGESLSVTFSRADFVDADTPSTQKNTQISISNTRQNIYDDNSLSSLNASTQGSISSGNAENISKKGNFGTPSVSASIKTTPGDSTCAGIIFDPCIYWEMPKGREGGEMYYGTTRLYQNFYDVG